MEQKGTHTGSSEVGINSKPVCDKLVYDFDIMLARRKEEKEAGRKRSETEILNANGALIAKFLEEMHNACQEDRALNKARQPAIKKIGMLPRVLSQLNKYDLQNAFLGYNMLSVLTEWMAPMPDRCLPVLQIRGSLLKLLLEFPPIEESLLRQSGIGKAVMFLYKHPRETPENKHLAGKLITRWARPILDLPTAMEALSREEREQLDLEHQPPQKRQARKEKPSTSRGDDLGGKNEKQHRGTRPGEEGFVPRALVPKASIKDYVIRPKYNSELKMNKSNKKPELSRLDKRAKNLLEQKKKSKSRQAVKISVAGCNLAL